MARKPMVTRTFLTTQVTALCMDTQSCEALNKTITLSGTYNNENKLFKAVQEEVNKGTVKAVQIVDTKQIETLYGMTEQDFINNAVKLDTETRKPIDEQDDTETEAE